MKGNKRGLVLVGLLMAVLMSTPSEAQVALTTVQDTVYAANGTPAQGTVVVSWGAFTTAAGDAVSAGTLSTTLGSGGALSVSLAPNSGANPMGTYYTAVFHLADGTTSRQYWVVPAGGGPVKLVAVQNQVLPTSVAMQTVSKAYVDAAIAKAVAGGITGDGTASGSYVTKTGDVMSGPLVLPADPVSAQQAADKHYVDVNISEVSAGLATKVSTLPTANQTVTQPAGTQMEINSLNGVLDASGFLSGNGNNGFGNALASGNCTNGCDLRASQKYPGTEGAPAGGLPGKTHVTDFRGGARSEFFMDPQGPGSVSSIGTALTQMTTQTAPQVYAAHPGIVGANSSLMTLSEQALTGGSNQFPVLEQGGVPYNKSTYGVLQLSGNYNTQGQHVQFGNSVNCYSVGDCLAGSQYIVSAGGWRDQADEGTHPFDLEVKEDTRVFQGTCSLGCTTGATTVAVVATSNAGTQGDGRFLINKNPAKVISTGSIQGSSGDLLPIVNFSGTSFPVSVFLVTGQAATSQTGNLAPGTVTLPIATTGLPNSSYASSTSALPATTGVACIADTGAFPNFETASYKVVDGTHLQLTLNKVHKAGAMVGVGGLCGYGLEQTADTLGTIKQVFPVVGSPSANKLYYAAALSGVIGWMGNVNTGGYLNVSLPVADVRRSGGVVTITTSTGFPYDLNGLQLTVNGVADSSYNGTFTVTTTGGNTLTYASSGADGSSSGGSVGAVTGGFALYPMAEVLNVYNPASGSVDGTMTLAANTVAWATGDAVEEPHYFQQLVNADTEFVTQFVPRPIQYGAAGKIYSGQVGPGTRGWEVVNGVSASNYLGGGGTHQPPDTAFLSSGVWRNAMEMDAGQEAALRIHCNLHGCNRWNSTYALLSMDSHAGQDFLFFDPSSDTATWNLFGTYYSFSPGAFSAPNVNVSQRLTTTWTAPRSVMLGGATTSASPDVSTVIQGNGAGHVLELLANNGTARNTFTFSANLGGSPTALFEIGSGLEMNAKRSFYIYDYAQDYVPIYTSATSKAVGINTTSPAATLDVGGNLRAQSVLVGPAMDTQVSRTAPATLSVDDGTPGDSNGTISLSSVLLKDSANGHVYRLTVTNGALTTTQVQ